MKFANPLMKYAALLLAFTLAAGSAGLQAADNKKTHNLVVQVVDNDPARWKQALGIIKNLKADMGNDKLDVEIIAHGGGLKMVLLDSEVSNMLAHARKDGVVISACAASMKQQKVSEKDLYVGVRTVPFGAKQIMLRQEAGWSYLRM